VHPSWRDLVIDELAADADGRRRFLAAAGLDGALLALSTAGGAHGQRLLPLLVTDADWDALGDRVHALAAELDAHGHTRLLDALHAAIKAPDERDPHRHLEVVALASDALQRATTLWDRSTDSLDVDLLRAWYALAARVGTAPPPPSLDRTWARLLPAGPQLDDPSEVERVDAWLALCEVLADHDRPALHRLGFFDRHAMLLADLATMLGARARDGDPVAASAVARLTRLLPDLVIPAPTLHDLVETSDEPPADPWPPALDPTLDVDRILRDLA
jgi:hypothetical protein